MHFDRGAIVPLAALATQNVPQGYEYQDEVAVETTLQEVMLRPEFERLVSEPQVETARQEPEWLERFLGWLGELFGSDSVPDAELRTSVGIDYLIYAVVAAALIAVLAFILRSLFVSSRKETLSNERADASIVHAEEAPGERPPEEFWSHAQRLASQGQYKRAIRELLLGAMSAIERGGLIRVRKGLTNRDYFRAARGDMRESLQTIITTFELVYFGRREANAESFRACSRAFQKSFPSETSSGAAS